MSKRQRGQGSPRVLITGSNGRLGRYAVADFARAGYAVVGADRAPSADAASLAGHFSLDLTSTGHVLSAMRGCDFVVHLGAIPAPYRDPDEAVFRNNTAATFTVLQAAEILGLRRVVIASSSSILGHAWSSQMTLPDYAPIDEDHPLYPSDPYALSKATDELTCGTFHRRTGIPVTALRFVWVSDLESVRLRAAVIATEPTGDEQMIRLLWAYVDYRDAARACRLSVESRVGGFRTYNVSAADTIAPEETEAMIVKFAPAVRLNRPIAGFESTWDTARIRDDLGFTAEYSWRSGTAQSSVGERDGHA